MNKALTRRAAQGPVDDRAEVRHLEEIVGATAASCDPCRDWAAMAIENGDGVVANRVHSGFDWSRDGASGSGTCAFEI